MDLTEILSAIKPHVFGWIAQVSGGGGAGDLSAHITDGRIHHLDGMAADDHSQYLHLSNPRTVATIHTFSAGLKIGSASLGWDGVDDVTLDKGVSSADWVSGLTGWHISEPGEADFRRLNVDELHAKAFIADIEQALAGGQIISKSVAILSEDFTVPAASGSIVVEDLPGFPAVDVFAAGDVLRIRVVDRSNGGLQITDVWGTVSGTPTKANNQQTWTFTRTSGTAGATVYRGAIVLDYGQSGDGYWEVTTLDADSPFAQIVTWSGNPWTPGNLTLRARLGNLDGITDADLTPSGWGLYSTNAFLKGDLLAAGGHVQINSVGITIDAGSSNFNFIKWDDGVSSQYVGLINVTSTNPTGSNLSIAAKADNDKDYATIQIEAIINGGSQSGFLIQQGSEGNGFISANIGGSTIMQWAGSLVTVNTSAVFGGDLTPTTNYSRNIGSLNKKFLTLHAAELWVENLVAQNTLATIGGRILIGPTTALAADVGTGDTSIQVKHNELASGDRVYLEADGKIEFMAITSAPTGTGPYTYTVTRNLDGSGANAWFAGDAVFNTGQAGEGFIDLYSVASVKGGLQAGPTIVGNVRNSTTYNDWAEHWALGNLSGLYGYGATAYGFAAGKYATGQPWIGVDATNGFRVMRHTTQLAAWDVSGNILIGQASASQSNVYITAGAVKLRNNTTDLVTLSSAGAITVGEVGASKSNVHITAGALALRNNTTDYVALDASGVVTVGRVASGQNNLHLSSGGLQMRNNTTVKMDLQSDGDLFIGENTAAAATTVLAIFTNAQSYNGESVGAGDLLLGDNSSGSSNLLWDKSDGALRFRGGTTTRVRVGTDGRIYMGSSATDVWLDGSGLSLTADTLSQHSAMNEIKFVEGSAGSAVTAMRLYGISDTTFRSLTLANLASSSSQDSLTDVSSYAPATNLARVGLYAKSGSSTAVSLDVSQLSSGVGAFEFAGGNIYLEDDANANMTLGLTINQGAADNEILAFKSSDVAHGMTSIAETDTYGFVKKLSATAGGLYIYGLKEDTSGSQANGAMVLQGALGEAAITTKSTIGFGVIRILANVKSGTGTTSVGTDGNMVSFENYGTVKFILDADGDSHQDVGTSWTNFDTFDDVALLTALSAGVSRADDPVRLAFGRFLEDHRDALERARLVQFNPNGHHFVNMSRLAMLLTGAVRQLGLRLDRLEAQFGG